MRSKEYYKKQNLCNVQFSSEYQLSENWKSSAIQRPNKGLEFNNCFGKVNTLHNTETVRDSGNKRTSLVLCKMIHVDIYCSSNRNASIESFKNAYLRPHRIQTTWVQLCAPCLRFCSEELRNSRYRLPWRSTPALAVTCEFNRTEVK